MKIIERQLIDSVDHYQHPGGESERESEKID
jgi:hypothetical protein